MQQRVFPRNRKNIVFRENASGNPVFITVTRRPVLTWSIETLYYEFWLNPEKCLRKIACLKI